jgi:alpha-tubulin suppressor-like RCC1 family protein
MLRRCLLVVLALAGCKKNAPDLGAVACWGLSQRADEGRFSDANAPVSVPGLDGATALITGGNNNCARVGDAWRCWGAQAEKLGLEGTAPQTFTLVPKATQLAFGSLFACALSDGKVRCWGSNLVGALGNGAAPDPKTRIAIRLSDGTPAEPLPRGASSDAPVEVTGLDDAVEIAAGSSHACARRKSGAVVCWGSNQRGQRGSGDSNPVDHPVAVPGIADAARLVLHEDVSCAQRTGGKWWCWGTFSERYPHDSHAPVILKSPTEMAGLDNAKLAISDDGACAVLPGGEIQCFTDRSKPSLHKAPPADDIVAGMAHFCARLRDGHVACWGENYAGSLGHGDEPRDYSDESVAGLDAVTGIAGGSRHTCVLRAQTRKSL